LREVNVLLTCKAWAKILDASTALGIQDLNYAWFGWNGLDGRLAEITLLESIQFQQWFLCTLRMKSCFKSVFAELVKGLVQTFIGGCIACDRVLVAKQSLLGE
jgi:hypothetical protein